MQIKKSKPKTGIHKRALVSDYAQPSNYLTDT